MVKEVFSQGRFELSTATAFENAASASRVAAIDLTDFSFDRLSTTFDARGRDRRVSRLTRGGHNAVQIDARLAHGAG
jgi:hypothetical protein